MVRPHLTGAAISIPAEVRRGPRSMLARTARATADTAAGSGEDYRTLEILCGVKSYRQRPKTISKERRNFREKRLFVLVLVGQLEQVHDIVQRLGKPMTRIHFLRAGQWHHSDAQAPRPFSPSVRAIALSGNARARTRPRSALRSGGICCNRRLISRRRDGCETRVHSPTSPRASTSARRTRSASIGACASRAASSALRRMEPNGLGVANQSGQPQRHMMGSALREGATVRRCGNGCRDMS